MMMNLFVDLPINEKIENAIFAIEECGLFSIHVLELEERFFEILYEARPCLCVFSILDKKKGARVFDLLSKIKQYAEKNNKDFFDPSMRILLFSKKNLTLSLLTLGVHEVISFEKFSSISFRRANHDINLSIEILYRLTQHFHKANRAFYKNTPSIDVEDEEKLTRFFKEKNSRLLNYTVTMKNSFSNQIDGKWQPIEVHGDQEVSVAWQVNSVKEPSKVFIFYGDRPEFDFKKKSWVFHGEKPRLVLQDKNVSANESSSSQRTLFFGVEKSSDAEQGELEFVDSQSLTLSLTRQSLSSRREKAQNKRDFFEKINKKIEQKKNKVSSSTAISQEDSTQSANHPIIDFLENWKPKNKK